ncbi:MAG: lysylphosphatidylglycerol synthase transmembrane domain-containing protein, partial [Clostridia bacterium]|nr:lysylphosphatidylglycerol synthase transmembrane domain-containing protein [Clostridia bacterium]
MKLEKKHTDKTNIYESMDDAPNFSNSNYEQICIVNGKDNGEADLNNEKTDKKEYPLQLKIDEKNTTDEDKEKLEEAVETVKKQSNKKKKWLNLVFLLINLVVVAGILTYQLLKEDSVTSLAELSSQLNGWVMLLLVGVFALLILLETSKFWILIYKATNKNRFALSYKLAALGRYYDNVTPFATGEQPFQIYYLNKHGVSGAESVSIPMGKYVIWQLSFVTFTLVVMIFSISLNSFSSAGTAVVTASSWIGFSINSALVFLVGLISINKKIGTKLITGFLKLLHKLKI